MELDGDGREARRLAGRTQGALRRLRGTGPGAGGRPLRPLLPPAGALEGGDLGARWGIPRRADRLDGGAPPTTRPGRPGSSSTGRAGKAGQEKAWAFRLEGREWRNRGSMTVAAVGQPPALPAPQRKDGVLTGTGLFSASGPPQTWVSGLPGVKAERRGQLIALTGTAVVLRLWGRVVYLSGRLREDLAPLDLDSLGLHRTRGSGARASDYWVDFPFGDHRGSLRLVWFDRRRPAQEVILLTRLTQSGDWVRLIEAPAR